MIKNSLIIQIMRVQVEFGTFRRYGIVKVICFTCASKFGLKKCRTVR